MRLRKLKQKDAPLMLEWMHDEDVVCNMQANFAEKTLQDCEAFIAAAQSITQGLHMAIVDENDEYYGTVSLKHIIGKSAEFAITVRKAAMGKGYAKDGMTEIIRLGFEVLGLDTIYWCVSRENKRAIRFYDKNGYPKVNIMKSNLLQVVQSVGEYAQKQIHEYDWYLMINHRQ